MFRPGSTQPRMARPDHPLDIPIIDDDEAEPIEYFEVHFVVDVRSNSAGYAFPSAIAHVTIVDDDRGTLE